LNSNRRDLWSGDDLEGQDQKKALWNRHLLAEVIAVACVDLIEQVASEAGEIKNYYSLWPDCDHLTDSWQLLGTFVYRFAAERKLLYSRLNGGEWVNSKEAVFVPHNSNIAEEIIEFLLERSNYFVFDLFLIFNRNFFGRSTCSCAEVF
jgi:hypothetical protein